MRLSTLLLSLSTGTLALAQPVLQYANVNLIGSSYNLYQVTNPGSSDPSTNGANVTWNFSSATTILAGTASFVAPASTPYAASYPSANLATAITVAGTTGYTYYNLSSAQLDLLAEHVGTDEEEVYTDPKTILVFPFAFGGSFVDNHASNGNSSSVTRAYTGYGTVILPGGGSTTNVVKTSSTSGSIAFFTSNPVAPLVSIEDDGSAVVWTPSTVGMGEVNTANLHAWPNPASELIQLGTVPGDRWSLVDMQGRVLMSGSATSAQSTISLAGLGNGHYIVRVANAAGVRTVPVQKL